MIFEETNLFESLGQYWPFTIPAEYEFGVPVLADVTLDGFVVQPVLNIAFSPSALFGQGTYEIASVSVVSGGSRPVGFGIPPTTFSVALTMSRGHILTSPILRATVASGVVQSVAVIEPGVFLGPGKLISVGPIEEPLEPPVAGSATTTIETIYSEPDLGVRVRLPPAQTLRLIGSGDVLSVEKRKETDANGRDYWAVDSIEVVNAGTGFFQNQPVDIAPGTGVSVARPARAYINLPPRETPYIHNWWTTRGSGSDLEIPIEESGQGQWSLGQVTVNSGGYGHVTGDLIRFQFGPDTVQEFTNSGFASMEIVADDDGAITEIITTPGVFYVQPTRIGSITVTEGGRYYTRKVVRNEIPFPDNIACIEGEWEDLSLLPPEEPLPKTDVGEIYEISWSIGNDINELIQLEIEATRRCGTPTVTLTLQ